MLDLLNSILDHSQLADRSMKLELTCFSLCALLDAICKDYRPAAEQKGLAINLIFSEAMDQLWIRADALRLRQITMNLLSNAIKFTDAGSVTLHVSGDFFRDNTCMLSVSVTDTGIGIPISARKHLFEAWSQADDAASRHYDGSGLGLYICRELVALMRGSICCKSQPGAGSTFTFRVPVSIGTKPLKGGGE
jgi:signal transduction histidine kinase